MINATHYEIEFCEEDDRDIICSFGAPCPPAVGDVFDVEDHEYEVLSRIFYLQPERTDSIGVICKVKRWN